MKYSTEGFPVKCKAHYRPVRFKDVKDSRLLELPVLKETVTCQNVSSLLFYVDVTFDLSQLDNFHI
jgi:hypothetical protein